ncbi:MAG: DUF433 domain-containing protein [Microcoleus sp. SIO2G3]|nr:DUF433 domain-containing protein [Microcoleus sp. SIO2G3]
MQLVSREHIEIASDVRSGKPRIVGTRIAVEDVAVMHSLSSARRAIRSKDARLVLEGSDR